MDMLEIARRAVKAVPEVMQYLDASVKAAVLGYDGIRSGYWTVLYDSVEGYLTGNNPVTGFRNRAAAAMSEAFTGAVYEAWYQAGAELPLTDDVTAWLSERIGAERVNIEDLFSRLKKEWTGIDPIAEANTRAEAYARTLDAMYGEAKMRGMKNATLVFDGDDGAESCPDCQKMKGKRHTIKYILDNNLIPRPGNDAYECKGYRCEHYWMNPKTGERFNGGG
jgi:hypothetical protein